MDRAQEHAPRTLVVLVARELERVPGAKVELSALYDAEEECVSVSLQSGKRMGDCASGRTK